MNSNLPKFGDLLKYDSHMHGKGTSVVVTAVNQRAGMIYGNLRTATGVEEQRAIPMSNESVQIIQPKDIQFSSQLTTNENNFLTALNNRSYAPVLQDLLTDPANHTEYLLPSRIKQFKNRAFGFPAKIEQTDRCRFPMWIMLDNGKLDVAYVYLSDSDGRFHISPGFDAVGARLIKGDNFGLSYVTANRLDPEIERYIHKIYQGLPIPSNFPRRVKGFTGHNLAIYDAVKGREGYQYADFKNSTKQWTGSEVFRILGFHEDILKPSRWHKVPNLEPQSILKTLCTNDSFFRYLINFSKIDFTYGHINSIKGNYQVNVFSQYMAGRTLEWHVGIKGDQVWLDNIFVRMKNPLNAYGVHGLSVDSGGLISKPWEYKSQVGKKIMEHPQAHTLVKDIRDMQYISLEPFLTQNPIVRLYKEYNDQSGSIKR